MTDLRGEFTPELESDATNSGTIFKTVAALIVALMLGVLGAYYYFGPGMSNEPTTRIALVSPPQTPLKPVIAPRMVTPAPQASLTPTPAVSNDTAGSTSKPVPSHPRRYLARQSADVQPEQPASATASPDVSPALTAPTPPVVPATPVQAADPTQPSPQP